MPSLLLPGRPSRGGGRSASTHPEEETVGVELARLHALHPAVSRRVLRAAARNLGARLSFEQTELLLAMADLVSAEGSRARKAELPGHITVERSPREIRLTRRSAPAEPAGQAYAFVLPGEIRVPEYRVWLRGEAEASAAQSVVLRPWRAGDRVTLCHTRGPKKVAEVLDRLHVIGAARSNWPVVESQGEIVWMRGVEVQAPGFRFTVQTYPDDQDTKG
jgi:tRNA(Ile)-lysidine synthase